jgi:hypothetical protein
MFRVVDRSKLSLKFGKDTFIDCHFSPCWPSWARTETVLFALRTTLFLFAVDVAFLDNLNRFSRGEETTTTRWWCWEAAMIAFKEDVAELIVER